MNREEIINYSANSECAALIIRHSIREKITDAKDSFYQLLTPEGKQYAVDFGEKLHTNRPIRLYHSIVERCKETADCIAQGYKGEVLLIEPMIDIAGFYAFQPTDILSEVNRIGVFDFISHWFKGTYPIEDIQPAIQARNKMIQAIVEKSDPSYLNIFVTHDWNIILMLSLVYDIIGQKYLWPDFMDGVALLKNQNDLICVCDTDKSIKI